MTALIGANGPSPGPPRLAWGDWVEETARTGPFPFRLLCEAQLGFDQWWRSLPRSAAAAEPPQALAERLLAVSMAILVVGLGVGVNVRATGQAVAFDREPAVAVSRPWASPAADEGAPLTAAPALLPPAPPAARDDGKGPSPRKGADRVAPPPVEASGSAEAVDGAAPPPTPVVPARRGALPVGKGMWIWLSDQAEGGNPQAIVSRAQAAGLTHLYVRTASLRDGFYAADFLNRLLPVAHAARIRVYAWDFPYLDNVAGDVERALQAIRHVTPDGHRVDGYVADIELRSMGVNVAPHTAQAFGSGLRRAVGPNYPLIACVPRPSPKILHYPYADVVASFDAVAPMNYWMHRDPVGDIVGTFRDLAPLGKPVIPVGQAYDAVAEGGPPGVPPRDELLRFMQAGEDLGAIGVSWWSWHHADQQAWDAIRDAGEFRLPPAAPESLTRGQVRAYQTLLTSLGFPVPVTAAWDPATTAAVQAYQQAARLTPSGVIDEATHAVLFTPFAAPLEPQP